MKTVAILATGPSMSQVVADTVRGRCGVVAVSDAYRLAPWADALASHDSAWWRAHPEALAFAGRKVAGTAVPGCDVLRVGAVGGGSNSGLLACHVAVGTMGATRVLLLGFDMRGDHYFGQHPEPLKNTTPQRFDVFRAQFARFKPAGVEILNCTPGSALLAYPSARLEDALCSTAEC